MFKVIIDKGADSEGYKYIRSIFEEIGLADMFDWFYTHNEGRDNPYHNNTHTFCVVELIRQYCDSVGADINDSGRRQFLVAALFHDFNHSGGKEIDSVNIKRANEGFFAAWQENRRNLLNKEITRILPFEAYIISSLIRSTEYPYDDWDIKNESNLIKFGKALRQADILSYEHDAWHEYVFEGLLKELGDNAPKDKNEALIRMLDFHKVLVDKYVKDEFFVEFAKEHFPLFEENVRSYLCL